MNTLALWEALSHHQPVSGSDPGLRRRGRQLLLQQHRSPGPINIRRVAWGVRDVEGARQSHCTISETVINALAAEIMKKLM